MEIFFQTACVFDESELTLSIAEIGYEFADQLPTETLCKSIIKMAERKKRDEVHRQWAAMLPMMSTGMIEYKSFDDYYEQCTGAGIDMRPSEEIMSEIKEIREKIRKEGLNGNI